MTPLAKRESDFHFTRDEDSNIGCRAWARIVAAVPGSVLLLLRFPAEAEVHLVKEAAELGVVRARSMPFETHPCVPYSRALRSLFNTPACMHE